MNDTLKLNLTDQQRAELKSEFENLKTIEVKLDFWKEKLETDFSLFDYYTMDDIQDFYIYPQTKNEFHFLNTRNLNRHKELLQSSINKNRFLEYDERVKYFNSSIETVQNKESFINEELRKLDNLINQKEIDDTNNHYFSRSRFFLRAYKNYIENGQLLQLDETLFELRNLVEADQGLTIAKYKLFIEEFKSPKKQEKKKNYSFSHDQQIFILDYLGFYKDLDNVKRGKLYGAIINRDSETTRQRFSSIETRKTVENLNPILSYFTELGFTEQIQLVRKEIDRKEEERTIKKNKR